MSPPLYDGDYDADSVVCDTCVPGYLRREWFPMPPVHALSVAPFVLTFIVVSVIAWRKLFPVLSGQTSVQASTKQSQTSRKRLCSGNTSWLDKAAITTFSATIGLSAVLAELIFCEISGILDPDTRSAALESTISLLLISLILVIPALEVHTFVSAMGLWNSSPGLKRRSSGRFCCAILFDALVFGLWLCSFWWVGRAVLGQSHFHRHSHHGLNSQRLNESSLERIGIIGVALMASLAGFAAVSSIWQTYGVKTRLVTEAEVARKQHGLESTTELLLTKESRWRALERKMADANTLAKSNENTSFMNRMLSSAGITSPIGSSDMHEYSALEMEISGLQMMQSSLAGSLQLLQTRYESQRRSATAFGRVLTSVSYLFSIYCLYRISATLFATLRRWWAPTTTFATTDPINNFLAIFARAWDPSLNKEAWARQISFLLSGIMLLASFNAVLQTVVLFTRLVPTRCLRRSSGPATGTGGQQNILALLVGQISATYVISSALLLRGNLPKEMGNVIDGVLPLEMAFVERWFEGWFLGSCAGTALGILALRSIGAASGAGIDDEDWLLGDEGDLESGGKRRA